MADDLLEDLAGALEAGKLQGSHDHVARVPLVLDTEGKRNVNGIAQRARRDAEREQQRAARRMAGRNGDGGDGVGYAFGVFAFETAWGAGGAGEQTAGAEGKGSASEEAAAG